MPSDILKIGKSNIIQGNRRLIIQFILAVLILAVGTWFLKHERIELGEVKNTLGASRLQYLLIGVILTVFFIVLQGMMYKMAFAAVDKKVPLALTILLYLKRNFISIFLPAGGVASLAFFTSSIESKGVSKSKIHFASSIYAFFAILSVVLVALPIFIYALIDGLVGSGEWVAFLAMVLVVFTIFLFYRSIAKKGRIYRLLIRLFPSSEVFIEEFIIHTVSTRYLVFAIITSVIIDITGIFQLYIAMLALNFHPSLFIAMMGYLTAIISLFVSPFMRGLGAVEISISYVLTRFGYSNVEAISITFLYRFFGFWLPLLAGSLSFLSKINKLLMRVIPALLIFSLGIINIVSVLTPAISDRVQHLQNFLPVDALTASNYFVFIAGVFLLLTATFLLKGLRNAWWIALFLSMISAIGHLTKAIDYEEASVALVVFIILLVSRKEYYIKGNPRLHFVGIRTSLLSILAVLIYGTIGFYFLDKKHFDIDFNLLQSIRYTFLNFLLVGSTDLVPNNAFARDFLLSINASGLLSLSFFFYTIIRPYIFKKDSDPEGLQNACILVEKYGCSGLDYFKTYRDKMVYIPADLNAFIAYRVSGNFAVALESPVAESPEKMKECIILFDRYCYENGLKSLYYRVPEENLQLFKETGKKCLFIGQEGIVDLNTFSLEGGTRKALRNSVNKVAEKGYKASILTPPVKDGLLQKLKAVSDNWLHITERKEIVFSQGMFIWEELKQQTLITVENAEEKMVGFLNIIPDYADREGTYDLIRKTDDAPGGVIDFMLIELFKYLKARNIQFVNLGFAPLSGNEVPHNLTERSMNFAYNKIQSFSHYKGLRDYKEKFSPVWTNKYLIYDQDFDLLQAPVVLSKVIKP
jgi:phosphatidylglycerol lysyltransferase